MTMAEFATYTDMAEKNAATMSAEALLAKLTEKDKQAMAILLDASQWAERDISTFREPVLIDGRWGRFWLVQSSREFWNLKPEAPVVTLRGLKALGRGMVRVLAR